MNSIRIKLYIFIILTIILIASGTIIFSYITSSRQINNYYKQMTTDNAQNFASNLDGEYLAKLRSALESEEYQEIRDRAEEEEDEEPVREYLVEHGLWDEYIAIQESIDNYLSNMSDIKYIYVVGHGDQNATLDMYMIDSSEEPLYESGYYEVREETLRDQDLLAIEPTISYSDDWGWLCSDYAPVYDSNKNVVCIVGCDVDVDDMVNARHRFLIYILIGTVTLSILVLIGAVIFVSNLIIKPLHAISDQVKSFTPSVDMTEEEVINIGTIKGNNEITEIYDNIRSMESSIVDYIHNIHTMQGDIEKKDTEITKLSMETFKDSLTHVGNKGAYLQKMQEINQEKEDFAIVMVDINNLKEMNDKYGHKAGDLYIQGCCKMICDTFRHSPVFRIGGDEFVVVVENKDYPNRYTCLTRLKLAFEKSYNQEAENPWEKLSAAVGMAENSSDDYSAELVFKRADKAMYEDKLEFRKKYGSYR